MAKSSLLLNEKPLLIMPDLATKIGLNESIVIQQIHYWLLQHEEQKINYHDNRYWVYNSYKEWNKQFPFWSERTIKAIITRLENLGLVISGNYNKLSFDRTKWYSINYKRLESLCFTHSAKVARCIGKGLPDHGADSAQPIPEITSEITSENTKNDNGVFSTEKDSFVNREVVNAMKTYMNDLYKQRTKKKHPVLKPAQYRRIYDSIASFAEENSLDYDAIVEVMICYFNNKALNTDWNINHFATEGIMQNRLYESGVI